VTLPAIHARCRALLAMAALLFAVRPVLAAQPSPAALHDLAQYTAAKSNHLAQPARPFLAWQYARACYDWADHATNNPQRAALAEAGAAAARLAIQGDPTNAAGPFYLAMNLGQLARTKTLGALPLVLEMERQFLRAIELGPEFHHAGPHRSLGRLYLRAPGWPASIGSKAKAREQLEKAVALAPDWPDNHLTLLAAYAEWEDPEALRAALARYRKLLPQARLDFPLAAYPHYWPDWEKRLADLETAAKKLGLPAPAE